MIRPLAFFVLLATLLVVSSVSAEASLTTSTTCSDASYSVEVLSEHPAEVGAQGIKGRHRLAKRGLTSTELRIDKRESSFSAGEANVIVTIEDHPGLTGTMKFIMEMNAVSNYFMCFQVMEERSDRVMGMCGSWDCGSNINRSAVGPIDAYKAGINDQSRTLWIRFRAREKHVHDIYMDKTLLYGKVIKFTLRMTPDRHIQL